MLSASELKNNTCFLYHEIPYKVLKYKHTHLGRGGAHIRVKVKNLRTDNVLHLNFTSNDRFEEVVLEKKPMQYLYLEAGSFYFMDPKSFEQLAVSSKTLGNSGQFLKEGETVDIMFWEDEALDIDLPPSVVVEITECDPGVKGNSVSNMYKPAMTKDGLKIKVPLFCQKGEKVKVDTRTGEYLERAGA